MTGSIASALIQGSQNRSGNDPIFSLNAEAASRSAAGESILNATLGVLMNDAGKLAVMPSGPSTCSAT